MRRRRTGRGGRRRGTRNKVHVSALQVDVVIGFGRDPECVVRIYETRMIVYGWPHGTAF